MINLDFHYYRSRRDNAGLIALCFFAVVAFVGVLELGWLDWLYLWLVN